jgi:hypothetical protein
MRSSRMKQRGNNVTALLRKILLALLAILCIVISYLEIAHHYNYGHLFSYGLHVDSISQIGDIGIPGQTHMYTAHMSNFTVLPVSFTACNYLTDGMGRGTDYPYAVQRWEALANSWQTVVEVSREEFCHPVPLSKIETNLVSKWLWPGMSVEVMDGEATGAREPFQKGDMARFVVFRRLDKPVNWRYAIPSAPFRIEDQVIRDDDVNYRVKH